MKAKTKFNKFFYKLPLIARQELVFQAYEKNPMTLSIIALEVRADTVRGLKTLKVLIVVMIVVRKSIR